MKPLVLALTLALFATLLDLGSAGTDAGVQVVASYTGYEKRQFPKKPLMVCVPLNISNMAQSETMIQNFVINQKSKGTIIPVGTPTIVISVINRSYAMYCKYVSDDYKGPFTMQNYVRLERSPQFAYYAKKVADQKAETLYAAAKDMMKVMAAVKDPKQAVHGEYMIVEITANNEVYVGPVDINVVRKGVPTV